MASRALEDLHPLTMTKVTRALVHAKADPDLQAAGITVLVTCTYRSDAEQAMCYAQGRTRAQLDAVGLTACQPRKGPIITRALPGQSDHNATDQDGRPASTAVDIVPLRNGKPIWGTGGDGLDEDPSDDHADDLEAWQRVAAHFKKAGLLWYGDPDARFREFPHFHDPEA